MLRVVTDYAYALDVLDKYDHQELTIEGTASQELFRIHYPDAMTAIYTLRNKYGGSFLFGNEKDQSFKGSLAAILMIAESKSDDKDIMVKVIVNLINTNN